MEMGREGRRWRRGDGRLERERKERSAVQQVTKH